MMNDVPMPGFEDWVPKDDNEEYKGQIFKIVGPPEDRNWDGRVSARYRKPFYATLNGAKKALAYFPEGSHIEEGDVTWRRIKS